jgi:hypothetical protein
MTPEERAVIAAFRDEAIAEIRRLSGERAELLGETIRVTGDEVVPWAETGCRLSLRTRMPGTVASSALTVNFPPEALTFVGTEAGADAAAAPITARRRGSGLVIVRDAP